MIGGEMGRGHRLIAALPLSLLSLLGFSLHATTAYSAPGDPSVGSPSGSVYVLPLEQGRADAAPKGGGTEAGGITGGGASQAGDSGSLYRSENNFGSSSRVPGLAAVAAVGGSSGGAGGAAGGASANAGGRGGGGAMVGAGIVAAEVSDAGNTSPATGIALLVGIGAIAAAVGMLMRRRRT